MPTIVHVPTDEIDTLVRAQGRSILLRYDEYRALLDAAGANDTEARTLPSQDVVRLSGEGTLDLTDEHAARFRIVYRIAALAKGPRSIGFASGGLALEGVRVEPEAGAGAGRYEEIAGIGRIYLDGPGVRQVTFEGSAVPTLEGASKKLDLWLPNPAAMALALTLPAGVSATIAGEGVPLVVESPAERSVVVTTRPTRGGHLVLTWSPSAKGTEGPSVIDADVKTLYTVGDGVVAVRALVRADVLRTPTEALSLEVPADLAVHSVAGAGVTGFTRSEDRTHLTVRLEKAVLGRVEALVQGERAFRPGPGVELPRVRVDGALRHQGVAALRFGADVNARAVRAEGGRRVPEPGTDAETKGILRYALDRADARVTVDVEPGALRVDATGTYYLNLAEPGQTLLATVTYRVAEGTLYRMSPRFPREFDLKELTLNGALVGFTRDVTSDGHVEITLAKGVPSGGEVLLLATLERAKADWVPEKGHVTVPFRVPEAGATRDEGYLAVGADAGFEVLDAGARDLVAVGAADLTARGLSAQGLVYGYRIDGRAAEVTLDVTRREPLVEAEVVTIVHPGPRRVDFAARAIYRIQRAGVRRLFLDLPTVTGDQVDIKTPHLRLASKLAGDRRPADVAAGYDRWQIELEQRAIGTQVVTALWFLDRDRDDWALETDRRIAARAPLARSERLLVIRRSTGLEVAFPTLATAVDVRTLDVTELPAEAGIDAQSVLLVLRLPPTRDGVEVAVHKHAGAAVLGAIATELSLETAVAREGILRTRAEVVLFNIDRQFVEVALPAESTLVGAIVDGQPVKPLVSPTGSLLITVPSTIPSQAVPSPRVGVALTYETRLGAEVGSRVRVEAPRFPGLEVLHTTQEVGVEPDQWIAGVRGDLRSTDDIRRPSRLPWLAYALGVWSSACHGCGGGGMGASAPASLQVRASDAAPDSVRMNSGTITMSQGDSNGDGVPSEMEHGFAGAAPRPAAPPAPMPPVSAPPPAGSRRPVGAKPAAPRSPSDPGAPPGPTRPAPFDGPSHEQPQTDSDMPTGESVGGTPALQGEPAMDASSPGSIRQGQGRGVRGPARKGQLSLDVPVFLSPYRVIATRVGGGGAVEIDLVSREGAERTYLILGLLAFGVGLGVLATRVFSSRVTVLAGLAVAGMLYLAFGATTLAVSITDAFSLLGLLLLVRRLLTGPRARAPRSSGTPRGLTPPVTTAALVFALSLAAAAPARADDGPSPASAPVPAPADAPLDGLGAGAVIVPRDPDGATGLASDDRVFVPLATWLELERKAHPDRDPELAALGQIATLVEATYRLNVGATNAIGKVHLLYARRGRGTMLVAVPLAGLAVTEARLDGQPVRLLLDGGSYRVALEREGDHALELDVQLPVSAVPAGRSFAFGAPTFAGATLEVVTDAFDGDLRVSGAGRVVVLPSDDGAYVARAYLGRPTGSGPEQTVYATLAERSPETLLAALRTRAESRVVHSVREGGTESALTLDVHVLQGKAPFIDLALPDGADVLEATGPLVKRWETGSGRLRLVFAEPVEGKISARIRTFHPSAEPGRREALPEFVVGNTTGESGLVIVNGDASLRLEADAGAGLFRTGLPTEPDAKGPDGAGRVLGAWRFAARPASITVRIERTQVRLEMDARERVTFGDDRVRTTIDATVHVTRARVGELTFALPGADEVRALRGPGIETWWTDGAADARRLLVRMSDLFEGDRALSIDLERRLGGVRDGLAVPRLTLDAAQADRGQLVLFALADVELVPGASPGWKALAPTRLEGQAPNVPDARPTHAYEWETASRATLAVAVTSPGQEVEAVVVTQVSPSDDEHRLEHLVIFDVRRGAAERLNVFVPDGGFAANDVVRARDLRELRFEPATKTDADGREVKGRLYSLRLQSAKSGLIEVTVSQLWPSASTVHVVRPEGVKATRWFALVRTFLDGEVEARVVGGAPDPADWADLPFLPTGVARTSVLRTYVARAPYLLDVVTKRHLLEAQAEAVVLSARAEIVVGLDGEARVRMRYRLFNRARQFLALSLPEGAVLFGAVAAGLPVKPLAGPEGSILIPVPKVPLGGAGYEVSITYRARAGDGIGGGGSATLLLPDVIGVEVDRTVISLRAPKGFTYAFDTKMSHATEAEALGDEVEASLREAQEVLKVAEMGTLDQRLFACRNSAPLVAEARERLSQYRQRGARSERAAALEADLEKLAKVQVAEAGRCEVDMFRVSNEAQIAAIQTEQGASNGETLVDLAEVTNGLDAGRPGMATTSNFNGNWKFNRESVPLDKASSKEFSDLKGRYETELTRRSGEERRKSVDVADESKSRAGKGKGQANESAKQESTRDDETIRYDENRNNYLLNDRLRQVQTAQRQLGTQGGGGDRPSQSPGGFVDLTSSGNVDLLARDGVEFRFSERLASSYESATRVGLMGVDVPLPTEGQLFWFVGARAGSALTFDASPIGTPAWQRALLFLGLLSALGFGLVRLAAWRRRASA